MFRFCLRMSRNCSIIVKAQDAPRPRAHGQVKWCQMLDFTISLFSQHYCAKVSLQINTHRTIVAQQPIGPPCSKSHVLWHYETSGHRVVCLKQTTTWHLHVEIRPWWSFVPLRGPKSNAFSCECSHWQSTDCSLETCCSSPRVSRLLQSKSAPEGLPCWSHPHSHSRSHPCRTQSRSMRFCGNFGSPLTEAVD